MSHENLLVLLSLKKQGAMNTVKGFVDWFFDL